MAETTGSWAAQVEAAGGQDVERQEYVKDGIKYVTEVLNNEKGQRVKIEAQYKVEKKKVPKAVAMRRKWRKYGDAKEDGAGPNPANTLLPERLTIQFVRNSAGDFLDTRPVEDAPVTADLVPKCNMCKGFDHFTFQCPYKHLLEDVTRDESVDAAQAARTKEAEQKERAGTYVPPHMKAGAAARGSTPNDRRDDFTVRITNLPEETTEDDLKDILSGVTNPERGGGGGRGQIYRTFLARDKERQRCKGFAFVTFSSRDDAERAILILNGHRYEHLVLKVEWARPNPP